MTKRELMFGDMVLADGELAICIWPSKTGHPVVCWATDIMRDIFAPHMIDADDIQCIVDHIEDPKIPRSVIESCFRAEIEMLQNGE